MKKFAILWLFFAFANIAAFAEVQKSFNEKIRNRIVIVPDERRNLSFTIVVKYSEFYLGKGELYIRGNGLGLTWASGVPLTKTADDTWEKTITFSSTLSGFRCESCEDATVLLSNEKFEYRILIDDYQDMVGPNFAIELPVSRSALPETPRFEVYPWFYTFSGTEDSRVAVNSEVLGSVREVSVYLPPSYYENPYKKYGVLFILDLYRSYVGDFKREIFDKYMATEGIVEETIVVGWGDYSDTERTDFLTPVVGANYACINGTWNDNCDGCVPDDVDDQGWLEVMRDRCGYPYFEGGRGNDSLLFLINEVLPMVKEIAEGRLSDDRQTYGILGFSHGGLMACYAAWTLPDVFGYAACHSASYYWPMNVNATMEFYFHDTVLNDPELLKNRKPQRIYIDVGGAEAGGPYAQDTGAFDAVKRIDSTDHFKLDDNLWLQFYPSHAHESVRWVSRIWSALSVLAPPKGTATTIANLTKK